MKKLIALALALTAFVMPAIADRITTDTSVLPPEARQTLKTYFGKQKVNHIKVDSNMFGVKDYDVVLNNGTEVEFNKEGKWTSVEAGLNGVPAAMFPKVISSYVSKNYKGKKIVEISVERDKYEVELSDGTDLEFDRAGNFLRVDR